MNSFGGVDFNEPNLTIGRVSEALGRMRATGVTRCLPTSILHKVVRKAQPSLER